MADPIYTTDPSNSLTKEQYATRAGVDPSRVAGDFGNFSITPEGLGTASPLPISSPTDTPIFDVTKMEIPKLEATPQEQRASDESTKLGSLYNKLVGKSQFQTEQEQIAGIPDITKTINDLTAQLTGIKNEAASIPLAVEENARGITTRDLTGQQNKLLRTNAIKALQTSTLLAAAQGNLATAQATADRAVAAKYGPIEEEINAAKENLNLILNDPLTSLQDKNRANEQLAFQQKREQALADKKEQEKDVWSIATSAAANGSAFVPSAEFPSLSMALTAMSQADSREEALDIAVLTGLVGGAGDLQTQVISYGDGSALINTQTGELIRTYPGKTPTGTTGLDINPTVVNEENKSLVDAFNSAKLGLSSAQLKSAEQTFSNLVNSGDVEGAKNYIIRTAMAGAGVDQQNQAIARATATSALNNIRELLSQLPTNLVTGTIENIAQKVGQTSDPKLAYVNSQIQQQIQIYRRSMTGVAFSPSESAEYAKIFPDITNVGTLNNTKINSLIDSFNNNNRAVLGFYIGDTNYNKLFGVNDRGYSGNDTQIQANNFVSGLPESNTSQSGIFGSVWDWLLGK